MKKVSALILSFLFLVQLCNAQIAGVFSVPGNFPSLAAAVNTLNISGVAGGVTINVSAGYTETAVSGGLKLYQIPGASSTNQVFIRKSGVGANPVLFAYTGTASPSGATQDGIWWLIGTDYVTIDGIDVVDQNTVTPATMEFGYGMYKLDANNGCQYNTIKNCNVNMFRLHSQAGGFYNASGSRGIEMVGTTYTLANSVITSTATAGAHAYNKIYSNYIQNCHTGIALIGDVTYTTHLQNDVGGVLASTGNTVVNFGGGSASDTYGIRTLAQYSLNVSNNVLNNNNGSGSAPASHIYAIYIGTATSCDANINSNTITIQAIMNNSVNANGIVNQSGAYASYVNTININANVFTACNYTNTSFNYPNLLFINSQSNARYVNINNNLIHNSSVRISNYLGINCANGYQVSVSNNTITNITCNNATMNNIVLYVCPYQTVSNNFLSGFYPNNGLHGDFTGISSYGSSTVAIQGNTITNVTAGIGRGIDCSSYGSGSSKNILNNVISHHTLTLNHNGLSYYAINLMNSSFNTTVNVASNTIYSISAIGTPSFNTFNHVAGITFSLCTGQVSKNKIYSIYSNGTGTLQALQVLSSDLAISNNIIGDLQMSNSTQSVAVAAVFTNSNTSVNMLYNSIYLNSPAPSGLNTSNTILHLGLSSANYTLANNILVNTSTPTGSGLTTIIRKTYTGFIPYGSVSNRNLYYTGGVQANYAICYDGTNTYSTLTMYKNAVASRDAQSVTENPPFLTTNGSFTNVLSMNPIVATQVEGGASPISGYTVDYIGTARNSMTPDIGAWEGNYTQADIFSPTFSAPAFTSAACNLTQRTLTVSINDVSGVAGGTVAPRVYYRVNFGLYTSVQGTLTAGTNTNGVWSFNLVYSAALNDIISYFVVAQDMSYLNNVTISPALGAVASDVNNVSIPPAQPFTYTVENNPLISATGGLLCSGYTFTINPIGAANYSISGGTTVVTPTSTSSYTVVGYSPGGCVSANSVVVTITVVPSPTVSVNSGTICAGTSFTFLPSGATAYTIQGGQNVITPFASGIYTVVGSFSNGCSAMANASITVNSLPFISAPNGTICIGESYLLSPNGASTYTYVNGGPLVSPVSTTNYSIIGFDAFGCPSSNSLVVNVLVGTILPTISVNSGSICSGGAFLINASGANTYTYSSVINLVNPTVTTVYTVTGMLSNTGCKSSATSTVTVQPLPNVSITSSNDYVCAGDAATLTANGANSYTWSFGATGTILIVYPSSNTQYTVTGKDAFGCVNTASVTQLAGICNGLEDLANQNGFSVQVFPNPFVQSFVLVTQEQVICKITDLCGKVVMTQTLDAGTHKVVVPEQSEGMYLLEVCGKNTLYNTKLIRINAR